MTHIDRCDGLEPNLQAYTDAGRATFPAEFQQQFEAAGPVSSTLYAALLFLRYVEPEKAAELVRARIARTDSQLAELGPLRERMLPSLTGGADHLFNHIEAQRRLDRAWLGQLLAALEADRLPGAPGHE